MHDGTITIDDISKIEGSAGLEVVIENGQVSDLKFIITDYRRFYTKVVKGKPCNTAPAFLSRICGTCSVSHLFASIEAVEKSQGIEVSEQTHILRRLTYDALMIRDHALHLYFFTLPDVLGLDSILDISDDPNDFANQLLHDSFDIKSLGTDISNAIAGAAIHAPLPTVGGFIKNPDPSLFPAFIDRLEKIKPQVLKGIKLFYDWKDELIRNTDYLCLRGKDNFNFLEGNIINSNGKKVAEKDMLKFLTQVVIPYSQSEGYVFSDNHEDYLVGALARLNLNLDQIHPRTRELAGQYMNFFPSHNIYDHNLAQAIEILHCVDDAIDILKSIQINPNEKLIMTPPRQGIGVGVVEAPRGTLYHMCETDDKGIIINYDVVIPTSQNQINIENDLKKYFNENIDKDERQLKLNAEKIVRTYDPCMSCATNFLKLKIIRK